MLFQNAKSKHLCIARAIVFSILLIDLLLDDHVSVVAFPREAFLEHGFLRLFPAPFWDTLFTYQGMSIFCILYGLVLLCGILGIGMGYLTIVLAIGFTIMFHGIARGFGGHVNHQELICLHALYFFVPKVAFTNFNILRSRPHLEGESHDDTSRFLLRCLTFWIFLTYYYIGVARLQSSDWRVYFTDAMTLYAVSHSVKWNYWDFGFAKNLLTQPLLKSTLSVLFPMATILEIISPLALFCRKLTLIIVVSLTLFHLSILFFMNIFFWQNLMMFSIPLMGWWIDRKSHHAPINPDKIIVFFDSNCGVCDGLIRHLSKVDRWNLLSFAPLDGTTAAALGLTPSGERKTWTIQAHTSDKTLERSQAVIRILQATPLWCQFADLIEIVPRQLSDIGYRIFARYRHLFRRKQDSCSLPGPEFVAKLLP